LALVQQDVTLQERFNQLATEIAQLKTQLAADEAKLKNTAQTANDAKLAVGFINVGVDNQFKTMGNQYAAMNNQLMALGNNLNALKSAYQTHTHSYSKRTVGFTNLPNGNGGYCSLIQKNVDVSEATAPPQ
jgi:hypothetical protein